MHYSALFDGLLSHGMASFFFTLPPMTNEGFLETLSSASNLTVCFRCKDG
jgi:hypothetical protein